MQIRYINESIMVEGIIRSWHFLKRKNKLEEWQLEWEMRKQRYSISVWSDFVAYNATKDDFKEAKRNRLQIHAKSDVKIKCENWWIESTRWEEQKDVSQFDGVTDV